VHDHTWVRVIDVAAALASRSYRWLPSPVTLRVVDPLGISGDTTVRIVSDGSASSVDRCTGEPDITVTVGELGSLILGSGIAGGRITALGSNPDGAKVAALFAAVGEPFTDSEF
jgi:predicted acetyltransferase